MTATPPCAEILPRLLVVPKKQAAEPQLAQQVPSKPPLPQTNPTSFPRVVLVSREAGEPAAHTYLGRTEPPLLILSPGPAYLKAVRAPPANGGERSALAQVTGPLPCGSGGTRGGSVRYQGWQVAWVRWPGWQRAPCTGWHGAAGSREDAGRTRAGFWGRFCDAAFHDASRFRPRSASIPASGA